MIRNGKEYFKDEDACLGVNNLIYNTVIIREIKMRNNESKMTLGCGIRIEER